jgi:acetyl esterase/lipase
LEANDAPETWFKGVDKVVNRVLITGGDRECLRDDIRRFADKFSAHHPRAKLVMQPYGVHNDPYFDFLAREKKLSELTPIIMEWLSEGFRSSTQSR